MALQTSSSLSCRADSVNNEYNDYCRVDRVNTEYNYYCRADSVNKENNYCTADNWSNILISLVIFSFSFYPAFWLPNKQIKWEYI